jgi:UDPglucose 6-dehydrogenase
MKKRIGFIGQGYIGKNYADDFEKRGYEVVRYSLEQAYVNNKSLIKDCYIVFVAVPTPTTPEGFDARMVKEALGLIGEGKIGIIKSTILPGATESLQKEFPRIYLMHSPEFLSRDTAAHDAAHPERNIIGIPLDNDEYRKKAEEVMAILPEAKFKSVCRAKEAEFIKYGGNSFFYFKNIFFNLFFDLVEAHGADWETVRQAIASDPRIGGEHTRAKDKGGRGAGGDCLIKDFRTMADIYEKIVKDKYGIEVLNSLQKKNIELLAKSGKDLNLLNGVYGEVCVNEIISPK